MTAGTPLSRRHTILLALLSATYFATNADSQMAAPLLPRIRESLGATEAEVVWLVACFGAAAAINSVLMGIVIDRIGGARILPVGYLVFCSGQLINALSPSLPWLIMGRIVTAIGSSTLSLGMMIRISEVFGEGRRSQAFGVFVAGGAAAAVIGLPIAASLASRFDFHAPFFGILCFIAPLGLAVAVLNRATKGEQLDDSPRESVSNSKFFLELFSRRRLMLVLSLGVLFNIGVYAMLTPLGLWAKAQFALSTRQIFSYYIVGGIAGLITAPIAGRLAARFGVIRLLHVSTFGLMIVMPLIPLVPRFSFMSPAHVLYGSFFLAASLDILRLVPFHVLSLEVAEPNYRARFMGLRNTISQSGIFLGAAIGGQLYANLAWGYLAAGLFAAFTCLVTHPILRLIEKHRPAKEEPYVETGSQ